MLVDQQFLATILRLARVQMEEKVPITPEVTLRTPQGLKTLAIGLPSTAVLTTARVPKKAVTPKITIFEVGTRCHR